MRTSLRLLLATLLPWAGLVFLGCTDRTVVPPRPNILFILADDLGWGDVGFHGSKNETPNIDRLAREGVRFEQSYADPTCSPTRAALLSGRYASRFGVITPTNEEVFREEVRTLPKTLHELGYETAISGKWHLGSKPEWGPRKHGFDRSYGSLAGGVDQWLHLYKGGRFQRSWHRDDVFVEEEGHTTDLITQEAVRFLKEKHDKPFFLLVAFMAVHLPLQEAAEWQQRYADSEVAPEHRHYAAAVTHLDDAVGRLLAALRETGQLDSTLVVFMSDNGAPSFSLYGSPGGKPVASADARPKEYPGEYEIGPGGSNLPFRGGKGNVYEGGIRVPAIVSWPGRLKPGVVAAPFHAVDWMPTLVHLAGDDAVDPQWDGRDLWPLLTSAATTLPPRTLYWAQGAIRRGDWKLIVRRKSVELYDLSKDPEEKNDVAAAHPDVVAELRAEFDRQRRIDSPIVLKTSS